MHIVQVLCVLIASFGLGKATQAQSQLFNLTAADGAVTDLLGFRVAVNGNRAVVTAPDHDDLGDASGSAYVFDTTTGQQLFELIASDGGTRDYFGYSLAVSGGRALVGAPYAHNVTDEDETNDYSGSAYFFDLVTGLELRKLVPTDVPYDPRGYETLFGTSVAFSGDRAVVGAVWSDEQGWQSGSAYVFDADTGQQIFKLLSSDGAEHDQFGHALAAFGDRVIVGVPGHDHLGNCAGAAYLFDLTTGQQLFELNASDGGEGDHFGWSVAIGAGHAVVGALYDGDRGFQAGAAYVFDLVTGVEIFKLTGADTAPGDNFGFSMALDGAHVVVGAPSDPTLTPDSSAAYVFELATGQELSKLQALAGRLDDYFAFSVGISGDLVLVGSPFGDELGLDSGAARLFLVGVLSDRSSVRHPMQAPRPPPWVPRR